MNKLTYSLMLPTLALAMVTLNAHAATKYPRSYTQAELQSMDTNHDAMVSKEEFLAFSEASFKQMPLSNGVLMLNNQSGKHVEGNSSSMNNQPIGTTSGKDQVNERDAVNGKKY